MSQADEVKDVVEKNEHSYEINYDATGYELVFTKDYLSFSINTVKKWLKDHNKFNKELRTLSDYLYNANGSYTNVIDYSVALPTLNRIIYSKNTNHKNYKRNKKLFELALRKGRERIIVRDMLFKKLKDGTAFYYFETSMPPSTPKYLSKQDIDEITEINEVDNESFNVSFIPLPTDYCKIIGYKNMSPLVAFDCSYFDQFMSNGLSKKLKRYPKEIRNAYYQYRRDKSKRFVVLDNDKTIALKNKAGLEDPWGRPEGLAGFIDMLYDEYFVESKRGVLDEVNSTIIYQTFPEGKEKGTSSLTLEQQKRQHENIKQALFSRGKVKGINFFSIAAGTKLDKLKTDIDLLNKDSSDSLRRIATSLGFADSMLHGSGGSMSSQRYNLRLISARIFAMLEQIQEELNKVINKNIIKDESNYIELYYLPITHVNRDEMVKHFKDLYTHASGSRQAYIASVGINPDAYLSLMDEEIENNFDEKYPPHQISFTQSNKDSDNKKSVDADPENPNTIKAKNYGINPME